MNFKVGDLVRFDTSNTPTHTFDRYAFDVFKTHQQDESSTFIVGRVDSRFSDRSGAMELVYLLGKCRDPWCGGRYADLCGGWGAANFALATMPEAVEIMKPDPFFIKP